MHDGQNTITIPKKIFGNGYKLFPIIFFHIYLLPSYEPTTKNDSNWIISGLSLQEIYSF